MAYSSNIHVAVYQVLDQVLVANVAPPGAKATIHSVIDDLYAASASRRLIEQAEGISLQLHCLEAAVARGDSAQMLDARDKLRSIAAAWLDHRINQKAMH
jgi:hypothetical protein